MIDAVVHRRVAAAARAHAIAELGYTESIVGRLVALLPYVPFAYGNLPADLVGQVSPDDALEAARRVRQLADAFDGRLGPPPEGIREHVVERIVAYGIDSLTMPATSAEEHEALLRAELRLTAWQARTEMPARAAAGGPR